MPTLTCIGMDSLIRRQKEVRFRRLKTVYGFQSHMGAFTYRVRMQIETRIANATLPTGRATPGASTRQNSFATGA
jgi:hypothetical protein